MSGKKNFFLNLKDSTIALFLAVSFCIVGFSTVKDYGFNWDFFYYFYRGEVYLNFSLTGEQHFDKDKIECRFQDESHNPFNYDLLSKELTDKKKQLYLKTGESSYGGFTGTLSALGCEIFHKKLNLLEDLDAHHYAYVVLASFALFFYFLFVSRAFSTATALLATGFLFLFPRFIGHIPSNPKDSVVTCLGIMAVYFFWRAIEGNKWKYLIPATMLTAFGVSSKFSAYMIPAILFLWSISYFIRYKKFSLELNKKFWGYLVASIAVFFLSVYIFSPIRWVDPLGIFKSITGLIEFSYKSPVNRSKFANPGPVNAFNAQKKLMYIFYPTGLFLVTTPVFTLFTGIIGFFISLKSIKQKFSTFKIDSRLLVVIWFIIPIMIASLPGFSYYVRKPRHFMFFIPAFCILAALGTKWSVEFLRTKLNRKISLKSANFIIGGMVCFGFLSLVVSVIQTHPYEITFFNRLIGGAAGAKSIKLPGGRTGIPLATDSSALVYRQGIKWLNKNAPSDSSLYLTTDVDKMPIVASKELRGDIKIVPEWRFNFDMLKKEQFYVMIIPEHWEEQTDAVLQYCYKNYKPVYSIISQGEPIFLIYKL